MCKCRSSRDKRTAPCFCYATTNKFSDVGFVIDCLNIVNYTKIWMTVRTNSQLMEGDRIYCNKYCNKLVLAALGLNNHN